MSASDLVNLGCRAETLSALAESLESFGPLSGDPDWLVSAVWLSTASSDFLASSSTKVLSDGYIARPLSIDTIDGFTEEIGSALPDISARLMSRRAGLRLPEHGIPEAPEKRTPCPAGRHSTIVLVRVSGRASTVHRVASALLFSFETGSSLLVGTDVETPAMVLSEEQALIDHYAARCEAIPLDEYLRRLGG